MHWLLIVLGAQVTTPTQQALTSKPSNSRGSSGSGGVAAPEPDNAVTEMLENTLWNRQLGVMSEEIVAALVCQIFEGARCHLVCKLSHTSKNGKVPGT